MKRTIIDRFIGFISPDAEVKRVAARIKLARAYDVAKSFSTSDWVSANGNSANAELKNAIGPGRQKARALVQNAPYAVKAVDVIVNETIGDGIKANIRGRNKTQTKRVIEAWKEWAESPICDYERRRDYYGLQQLAMRSIVESGEGLARKHFTKDGLFVQLLESDFIATDKDEGNIVQGVELDESGRRIKYHLYKKHPGDRFATTGTVAVPADQIVHPYKQVRPGQVRGITWAHAVIERMKDFDDFQNATLIRNKMAACFGGVIKTDGTGSNLDPSILKSRRESQMSMQPNTFWFMNPGEELQLISPPGVDGYSETNRETLREIASGWGISYESFTGDYSQSNYSSSRMGHLQMRKNIEAWRWNMFIPQFCEPTFKWFLDYAKMRGIDVEGVTVEWVPPAYSMIDPTKEIPAIQKEVRSGFKSYDEALLEQGRDPETTILKMAEWNKRFDELGLTLDIDPRKTSQAGLIQPADPNSEKENNGETNKEDASGSTDTSED